MSRKDYVAIAEVMRAVRLGSDIGLARVDEVEAVIDRVALDLCGVFARDNDSFDSERFLSACGVRT